MKITNYLDAIELPVENYGDRNIALEYYNKFADKELTDDSSVLTIEEGDFTTPNFLGKLKNSIKSDKVILVIVEDIKLSEEIKKLVKGLGVKEVECTDPKPPETKLKLSLDFNKDHFKYNADSSQMLTGTTKIKDLVKIYEEYGDFLFTSNVRGGLSKSDLRRDLITSAIESPSNFCLYHNGITIFSNMLDIEYTHSYVFLEDMNIVNGAQTITSFSSYYDDIRSKNERASKTYDFKVSGYYFTFNFIINKDLIIKRNLPIYLDNLTKILKKKELSQLELIDLYKYAEIYFIDGLNEEYKFECCHNDHILNDILNIFKAKDYQKMYIDYRFKEIRVIAKIVFPNSALPIVSKELRHNIAYSSNNQLQVKGAQKYLNDDLIKIIENNSKIRVKKPGFDIQKYFYNVDINEFVSILTVLEGDPTAARVKSKSELINYFIKDSKINTKKYEVKNSKLNIEKYCVNDGNELLEKVKLAVYLQQYISRYLKSYSKIYGEGYKAEFIELRKEAKGDVKYLEVYKYANRHILNYVLSNLERCDKLVRTLETREFIELNNTPHNLDTTKKYVEDKIGLRKTLNDGISSLYEALGGNVSTNKLKMDVHYDTDKKQWI